MNANLDLALPQLLTLRQAAQRLGICKRSLEREIARGKFPAPLKIGSSSRVRWGDVENYVNELVKARNAT